MKRILFVDDESNVLDGIRRMLHADRKRWDMEFAIGGEAGLRACEAGRFDVVISDMRMPGMDGATLLGRIRDLYPSTARLILSGYAEVKLATRAVAVAYRFLSKPYSGPELQATIERVCALQDIFCSPELRRIVGTIGELPSLSRTYTALAQAINDPAASMKSVADIIERDVAMSAKVLQLVNSGFFGLAQRVTSLQSAVAFLGMNTIQNLALASDTFRVFKPDARIPKNFCEAMQQSSRRVALIARTLPLDKQARDITVMAALLHDVGKLVLASKMPDEFCAVLSLMEERGCLQFEAEEQLLGISHAEVGAYLLGLWGINSLAVEAIAHHHHPNRIPHTGFDSSAAVYVANLLADEIEIHPSDLHGSELSESDRASLETLGVLEQFPAFRERALVCLNEN
jgi:HD-like signal output (HDOD) protein/ActR/RegA family two-component response regulator